MQPRQPGDSLPGDAGHPGVLTVVDRERMAPPGVGDIVDDHVHLSDLDRAGAAGADVPADTAV